MTETPPIDTVDEKRNKDERNWAMLCHLSGLALFLGIPFGNLIGPLVVWLIKRAEYPLVEEHGKEALNFQLSMSIYGLVSLMLVFVLVGFALLAAVAIADLVLIIVAAVKTSNGEDFRYPLTFRFLK